MKDNISKRVIYSDPNGEPFLIMSVREAISREVADFLDLVPSKREALHLLLGAIDEGFRAHDRRDGVKTLSRAG